ncbi:MAG: hypothetical protein Q7W55_04745 [Pseudohongiella sp.]|nr:hypothetical protein [Pseudohongiella sp.]MDO9518985.1 hypothetical protein [Pseudohongiella sp.]
MNNQSIYKLSRSRLTAKALWVLIVALAFVSSHAQACPDASQSGASLTYTSNELYSAKSHKVVAGGGVDLAGCTSLPGFGFVMTAPDFTMTFSGNSTGRELEFRLDTECDSVLMINDASGNWHYDDDTNGSLDAKIRLPKAANGIYDIWVGTRYSGTCNATLILETF